MSNLDEMLNQPEPAPMRPLVIRYGLLIALALFVVGLILEFTGLVDPVKQEGTSIANILNLVVLFGGIFLATKAYKAESGNSITFGKALGFGTLVALVIALATLLLSLVQVYLINPEMIEMIEEAAITRMEDQGMSEDEIEQAMPFAKMFMSPMAISIMAAVVTFIMAFIVALVTSAIHQNAKRQDVV